jgi:hypothetical protein
VVKDIKKVLFVGNSITQHAYCPDWGWTGTWGMAASCEANDYVHQVMAKIFKINPTLDYKFQNIAEWEREFHTYDISKLLVLREYNADLIIVRLGENVNYEEAVKNGYMDSYLKLIDYLNFSGDAVVVCTSRFWKETFLDNEIKAAADARKFIFVDLQELDVDENKAIGLFKHEGVAAHPGDAGMAAIADAIWTTIKIYFKEEMI